MRPKLVVRYAKGGAILSPTHSSAHALQGSLATLGVAGCLERDAFIAQVTLERVPAPEPATGADWPRWAGPLLLGISLALAIAAFVQNQVLFLVAAIYFGGVGMLTLIDQLRSRG